MENTDTDEETNKNTLHSSSSSDKKNEHEHRTSASASSCLICSKRTLGVGVGFTWFLLLIANSFHIYSVFTFLGPRKECYICTTPQTIIPWFVWFTSWCLWFTTAFFVVSQIIIQTRKEKEEEENKFWLLKLKQILFRIALPWSISVSISYTVYLFLTNGGRDLVDEENCYTLLDSATPKSEPMAKVVAYIIFDRITNFTTHYACMIINISMFLSDNKNNKREGQGHGQFLEYKCDGLSWIGCTIYTCLGLIIVYVHLNVNEVYCTDNIWSSIGMSVGSFVVIHIILILIVNSKRCAKEEIMNVVVQEEKEEEV